MFDGNTEYRACLEGCRESGCLCPEFADDETDRSGHLSEDHEGRDTVAGSADVYVSLDGEDWGKPVASFVDLATARVEYTVFDTP